MYLSKIHIQNYRGIRDLEVNFDPDVNIIVGENGSCKSALIDAIRLLYNLGEQRRDIFVTEEDFSIDFDTFDVADSFEISFEFRGLSDKQKGAFYEYMVVTSNPDEDYAHIALIYERSEDRGPRFKYYTGKNEGQKADSHTFELFQHYYLDALRDSTRYLLRTRKNILGELIHRGVTRQDKAEEFEDIIAVANEKLLNQDEVTTARDNVNANLNTIFRHYTDSQIGLHIEKSKVELIVNLIKPFLPFDMNSLDGDGLSLLQNSLGFNNLIYIATVLGDINQRIVEDELTHFVLLIEEPEAHLHPQLQLSLYNFLTSTNDPENSQLFITTHSPTLTSKVPLDNLILLDSWSYMIGNCFLEREPEGIIQNTRENQPLSKADFQKKKKQLERYIDVTRSQLFFSKGILLVEGISEELLIPAFCRVLGYLPEDYRLEIVNVEGTSFYPFLTLFNSDDETKRLPKPVSVLTDDDRFTDAKEPDYSFKKLMKDDYSTLNKLASGLENANPSVRTRNLESFANGRSDISIQSAYQTLELEIAINNVPPNKQQLLSNAFIRYMQQLKGENFKKVQKYWESFPSDDLTEDQMRTIAILLWKLVPAKAEFAQDFALFLVEEAEQAKETGSAVDFAIPPYIRVALEHLNASRTNDEI